jgi:hypothetical protein
VQSLTSGTSITISTGGVGGVNIAARATEFAGLDAAGALEGRAQANELLVAAFDRIPFPAANGFTIRANSDVADLASVNKTTERLHLFVDRVVYIPTVRLQLIDGVHAEPSQAAFCGMGDVA